MGRIADYFKDLKERVEDWYILCPKRAYVRINAPKERIYTLIEPKDSELENAALQRSTRRTLRWLDKVLGKVNCSY